MASAEPPIRALLTAGAGALMLALSPWFDAQWRGIPVRLIAVAGGGVAITGATTVHGVAIALKGDWSADIWAAAALAGGAAAALLAARIAGVASTTAGSGAGAAYLAAVTPAAVLCLHPSLPMWMLLTPIIVMSLLHAATALPRLRPLDSAASRWSALAALAGLAAVTVAFNSLDPFDLVPLLVGASLLAGGVLGGRSALVWTGAAIALVPSVLASSQPGVRPLILAAVGVGLVTAIPWIPRSFRGTPLRLVGLCSALAAAVGTATVRAWELAGHGGSVDFAGGLVMPVSAAVGAWAAFALSVGLGGVIRRQRRTVTHPWLDAALASAVVVMSATPLLLLGVSVPQPPAAALAPIIVLGALHVLSVGAGIPPLTHPLTRWTVLVMLLVVAAVTILAGAVDPFDLVTLVVGTAMVIAGAVRMRRDTAMRSWPALGPGLVVLLVPSLLADFGEPETWRLVVLGVVAFAMMLLGVFARLQAPFLLGAGVLALHGITQLWPVIALAYAQVWWWLWLAIAGVALIAIAATYERQLRLAKRVIATVAALR